MNLGICKAKRDAGIFVSDRLVHGSTSNIARTDRYTVISTYHAPADDERFDHDFSRPAKTGENRPVFEKN
jgi:hypothetical protein